MFVLGFDSALRPEDRREWNFHGVCSDSQRMLGTTSMWFLWLDERTRVEGWGAVHGAVMRDRHIRLQPVHRTLNTGADLLPTADRDGKGVVSSRNKHREAVQPY